MVGFLAVLSQLAGLAAMVLVSRSSDYTVFLAKQNLTSQCSQPMVAPCMRGLSTNTRPFHYLTANPETVATNLEQTAAAVPELPLVSRTLF